MSIGDSDNHRDRIVATIPRGWFASDAPLHKAIIGGLGDALAWISALIASARAQTRILTSSAFWLDLIAWDYFGARFLRRPNERDAPYRNRIRAELLRPRATRPALTRALTELTGREPILFEPWNPADCGGGYGIGALAYGGQATDRKPVTGYGVTGGGYGAGTFAYVQPSEGSSAVPGVGRYGSLEYPYQIFIQAFRPATQGIPFLSGYGAPAGGYGVGQIAYVEIDDVDALVPDAAIYATIADTLAAGTIGWTQIRSGPTA